MTIRKTLLTLAATSLMIPAFAFASDTAPNANSFIVKSSADSMTRIAAKAYKKGDYARTVGYSKRALKAGLSTNRQAIAYNNICAAEAQLGDMIAASEACTKALELRPDFEPAKVNKAALTVMMAKK